MSLSVMTRNCGRLDPCGFVACAVDEVKLGKYTFSTKRFTEIAYDIITHAYDMKTGKYGWKDKETLEQLLEMSGDLNQSLAEQISRAGIYGDNSTEYYFCHNEPDNYGFMGSDLDLINFGEYLMDKEQFIGMSFHVFNGGFVGWGRRGVPKYVIETAEKIYENLKFQAEKNRPNHKISRR